MGKMEVRYDELRVGDVMLFHGARERVVEVKAYTAPADENYPDEKRVYFKLEPADDEAEKMIGKFYSHGRYGGVGCLRAVLVARGA